VSETSRNKHYTTNIGVYFPYQVFDLFVHKQRIFREQYVLFPYLYTSQIGLY